MTKRQRRFRKAGRAGLRRLRQRYERTAPGVESLFLYTGRMFDETTGLQNNLHRWYDPAVGTWLGADPIGFAGGDTNLYCYCGNSPLNWIDPTGLQSVEAKYKVYCITDVYSSTSVDIAYTTGGADGGIASPLMNGVYGHPGFDNSKFPKIKVPKPQSSGKPPWMDDETWKILQDGLAQLAEIQKPQVCGYVIANHPEVGHGPGWDYVEPEPELKPETKPQPKPQQQPQQQSPRPQQPQPDMPPELPPNKPPTPPSWVDDPPAFVKWLIEVGGEAAIPPILAPVSGLPDYAKIGIIKSIMDKRDSFPYGSEEWFAWNGFLEQVKKQVN